MQRYVLIELQRPPNQHAQDAWAYVDKAQISEVQHMLAI